MMGLRSLTIVSAMLACSVPALSAEGNGEPFPGPDAAVKTDVTHPKYTMGGSAPFNYSATPAPTVMNNYRAAPGASADPYPFRMNGLVIRTQPDPRPAYVRAPNPNTHG